MQFKLKLQLKLKIKIKYLNAKIKILHKQKQSDAIKNIILRVICKKNYDKRYLYSKIFFFAQFQNSNVYNKPKQLFLKTLKTQIKFIE